MKLLECNSKGPRRTRTKINSTNPTQCKIVFLLYVFYIYTKLFLHKLNKIILYEIP